MAKRIGISAGDMTGIGPEVALKALALELAADDASYLILGDLGRLEALQSRLGLGLSLEPRQENSSARVQVFNPLNEPLDPDLAPGSPRAARAALAWLREGAARCLTGQLDALVTAPVNKESVIRSGEPFIGQTEFLSQIAGTRRTAMMLLGDDDRGRWLRVVLVTTHLPLGLVARALTRERIELAIELGAEACSLLGLPQSRVGVCGLNPHAGEGGKLGTEEQTLIAPAIRAMQARGLSVEGPCAADTLFHRAFQGGFDLVVAMYHDQGLAPLKMVAFENGVNWTLGLPFIRTSPDHGTAYDIAGRGLANPSSMLAAIRLAKRLALQNDVGGCVSETDGPGRN
jgi:4-hydroxythreonine-4-phosphate dehydrogenase